MSKKLLFITLLIATVLATPAFAAISLNPVGAGTGVGVSGTGAPPSDAVELFIDGVSQGMVEADASGDFAFTGLNITAGQIVRAQAALVWEFEDDTAQGWTALANATTSFSNGIMTFTQLAPGDSNMRNDIYTNTPGGQFDSSKYHVVEIRLKNNTDATVFNLYWWTSSTYTVPFTVPATMSDFQTFRIVIGSHANWSGNVNRLRFDFDATATTGTVEVDYIRVNENIAYEYDKDGSMDGHDFLNLTNVAVAGGFLSGELTSGDPQIKTQPAGRSNWAIDQDVFTKMMVGGTFNTGATQSGLLWSDAGGGLGGPNQLNVNFSNPGNFEVLEFDLGGYASWGGTDSPANFDNMRYDVIQGGTASDTFSLDYVRLMPTDAYGPTEATAQDMPVAWIKPVIEEGVLIEEPFSRTLQAGADFIMPSNGDPVTLSIEPGSHEGPGTGDWLSFGTGTSTATLSGTPAATDEGVSTWTLVADDGATSDTALLVVNVVGPSSKVLITIDDDSGNDAPYVNGVGANFTGEDALTSAAYYTNADPTLVYGYEIQFIDTDATADTYTGAVQFNHGSFLVHQVEDGNSATDDVGVTITDTAAAGHSQNLFRFQEDDSTLRGLSADTPIVLELPATDNPFIGFLAGSDANGVILENVAIRGGGNNRLAANMASENTVLRNIKVENAGNGVQMTQDRQYTIEDSLLANSGFPIIVLSGASVTMSDSRIVGNSGPLHLAGLNRIEMHNCELDYSAATAASIIQTPYLADNSEILLVDPVLPDASTTVTVLFNLSSAKTSFTIRSSNPSQKLDLSDGKENRIFLRSRTATANFVDCIITNGIDTAGNPEDPANVVAYNFERCIVNAHIAGATTETINKHITATNTIFQGDGVTLNLDIGTTEDSHTTLTHCTFFGAPSTGEFIRAQHSSGTLTANYCIFDASGTGWVSRDTIVSGAFNLILPGSNGDFGDATALTDVVSGTLDLDSVGRLTGGGGAAFDAAVGSTTALDIDGQVRPFGLARDLGADEAVEGGYTGWPIQAVYTDSAPTIDGVIDVEGEYSPAGTDIPVRVKANTLQGSDRYFQGVMHDGGVYSQAGADWTGDDDASVVMYYLWDNDALYIAADVTDDALFPQANPTVNAGDAFQIVLNYDQLSGVPANDTRRIYIPSWAAAANMNDSQYFQQFYPTSDVNPMTGITHAVTTSATGYVLETRIPWTAFTADGDTFYKPFPPVEGQTTSVLPIIDDHDSADGNASFVFMAGGGGVAFNTLEEYPIMTFVVDPVLPYTAVESNWMLFR